jgi:hypothetical protein
MSCVASVGSVSIEAEARMGEVKSLNQPQDLPDQPGWHPTALAADFFDSIGYDLSL